MNDEELKQSVQSLWAKGYALKQIARTLAVQPTVVRPLVRIVASEHNATDRDLERAECRVSPGWRAGLSVVGHPKWASDQSAGDESTGDEFAGDGSNGLVGVLVARADRSRMVTVCGYLLDVYCLGVKDALGPRRMRREELRSFAATYFRAWGSSGVPAPLELVRDLIFGAADYAHTLGFTAHPDFEHARDHLGAWQGPSPIRFGCDGKPMYTQGPYDDPMAVLRTLEKSVGAGNFDFTVTLGSSVDPPKGRRR